VRRKGRRRRKRGRREGGWRFSVLSRWVCLCPTFSMTCGLGNRKRGRRTRRRRKGKREGG